MNKKIFVGILLAFLFILPVVTVISAQGEIELGTSIYKLNQISGFDPLEEGSQVIAPVVLESTIGTGLTIVDVDPSTVQLQLHEDGSYKVSYEYISKQPEYIATFGEGHTPLPELMGQSIDSLYDNPAGTNSINYIAQEWTPIQASAQEGSGIEFLNPITDVADFTRDLAYALIAVLLVVIGIMIMFRKSIGGQAVVNIQNSIPRIFIALILISISFPLVAIMIDITNALTAAIGEVNFGGSELYSNYGMRNPWGTGIAMAYIFVAGSFTGVGAVAAGAGIVQVIAASIGAMAIPIALLVLAIIAFFIIMAFRIWFMLVKAIAMIFIDTVLLPLNFVMGTIPGNEKMIPQALLRIGINLLVFPISFFLIKFAFAIGSGAAITLPTSVGLTFDPTANTGQGPQLAGDSFWQLVKLNGAIMYGILAIIPSLPDLLRETLQVQGSQAIQKALGEDAKRRGKIPLIGGLVGQK